jgi:excisionase family DNA binding protein
MRQNGRKDYRMLSTSKMMPDVLTLDEVAGYLRLPKEVIEQQAKKGQIPARRIEDTWRFLKAAIDDWLRSQDSRLILLSQAGAFVDDVTLPELRASIYAARGRPEIEEEVTAGS